MKKIIILFLLIIGTSFSITDYIARGIYTNSGAILEGENENIKHPLSSITKLMTGLIAFDKLSEGKINLNTVIIVSEEESKIDGAKMKLISGEKLTIKDLLVGTLLGNQNNASVILARAVAGNEINFVKLMNDKAKKIGMKNTQFYTPTGLHTETTKKNIDVGTVEDLAKLTVNILKNKTMTAMLLEKKLKIKNNTITVDNIANRIDSKILEIKGLKTGYHSSSGYSAIYFVKKNNKDYIGVVLGALSEEIRNKLIDKELLNLKNSFKKSILIPKSEFIIEAPLKGGKDKKIKLYSASDIEVEMKGNLKFNKYVFLPKEIKAPIKKGGIVGTYVVSSNGKEVGRTNLITNIEIKKSNFLDEIKKKFTK